LATYVDLPLSKYDLAERSFHIARDILGKPVGKQDEYAAAFGGMNFITFNADGTTYVEPIELRSDHLREFESSLMLFFTGVAHNSWKLLQNKNNQQRNRSVLPSSLCMNFVIWLSICAPHWSKETSGHSATCCIRAGKLRKDLVQYFESAHR